MEYLNVFISFLMVV